MTINSKYFSRTLATAGAALTALLTLPSCEGIFPGVYDRPVGDTTVTRTAEGTLYVDASDWGKWHYIDLRALTDSVAANPGYNTSEAWVTCAIPTEGDATSSVEESGDVRQTGIYTYWYDVFGEGISHKEYRSYTPAERQPEPENWSIAVHRNNVRTNGGAAAVTEFADISRLPSDRAYLETLDFKADIWSETSVWTLRDHMLLGIVGSQGIEVNETLSSWLRMDIPPMPPVFSADSRVFVVRFADGTYAALQLSDYMSVAGTKCCLTINYRYPL